MQISFLNRLSANLLTVIAKTASYTSTLQIEGISHLEAVRTAGHSALWSAWHGQTMLLSTFLRYLGDHPLTCLIPNDWRGETLFHLLNNVGVRPYPINLEKTDMKTARKLAQLVKLIKKEGSDNFLAPDGPSGPSYIVKPGAFFLSEKVGAPILPIGAYSRAVYKVKRWDAYALPFPFARISINIGEPIMLPKETATQEKSAVLTAALHQVTMQAEANFYAAYANTR